MSRDSLQERRTGRNLLYITPNPVQFSDSWVPPGIKDVGATVDDDTVTDPSSSSPMAVDAESSQPVTPNFVAPVVEPSRPRNVRIKAYGDISPSEPSSELSGPASSPTVSAFGRKLHSSFQDLINLRLNPLKPRNAPFPEDEHRKVSLLDVIWRFSRDTYGIRPHSNAQTKPPSKAAITLNEEYIVDAIIPDPLLIQQHAAVVAQFLSEAKLDPSRNIKDKEYLDYFKPHVLGEHLPTQLQSEKDAEYYVQGLQMMPAKAIVAKLLQSWGAQPIILHSSSAKGYDGVTPDGLLAVFDQEADGLDELVVYEIKTSTLLDRGVPGYSGGIFQPLYHDMKEPHAIRLNWITVEDVRNVQYYLAFIIIQIVVSMAKTERSWGVITDYKSTVVFHIPTWGSGHSVYVSPLLSTTKHSVLFWTVCVMLLALKEREKNKPDWKRDPILWKKLGELEETSLPDEEHCRSWWTLPALNLTKEQLDDPLGIANITLPMGRKKLFETKALPALPGIARRTR